MNQTLGEEYVDIWQRSARTSRVPTAARRWSLVLLYCIPPYLAARQQRQRQGTHDASDTLTKRVLRMLPSALEVALEVNLALFYFSGSYYSLAKRLLGVKHVGHISSLRNYSRALIDLLRSPHFPATRIRAHRPTHYSVSFWPSVLSIARSRPFGRSHLPVPIAPRPPHKREKNKPKIQMKCNWTADLSLPFSSTLLPTQWTSVKKAETSTNTLHCSYVQSRVPRGRHDAVCCVWRNGAQVQRQSVVTYSVGLASLDGLAKSLNVRSVDRLLRQISSGPSPTCNSPSLPLEHPHFQQAELS